jgi:hypothetical protein
MAPGTWNAPGENALASASGAAYCDRSRGALTRFDSADAAELAAGWALERGE